MGRIIKVLIAVFAVAVLSGCVTATLTSSFNAADAAYINEIGTATVKGQAFLRRNDGVVVYGAGSEVFLIPKTAYSDERMAAIYGAGKTTYFGVQFKNEDPLYLQYTRKTVADGEGRFQFTNVRAGSYYITTTVMWMAGYSRQGGGLMERVSVTESQSADVIMSGQ